jgi:hypothetical protein
MARIGRRLSVLPCICHPTIHDRPLARPRFNRPAQPFTLTQLSDHRRSRRGWLHHDERWGGMPKQEPRRWTIPSSGPPPGLKSRFFSQRKDTKSMLRRVRELLRRGSSCPHPRRASLRRRCQKSLSPRAAVRGDDGTATAAGWPKAAGIKSPSHADRLNASTGLGVPPTVLSNWTYPITNKLNRRLAVPGKA